MLDKHIDTVRLSEAGRGELLQSMDNGAAPLAANKRKFERYPCRLSDVALFITHPGGGVGRFLVATRNISAGGVSLLHGGFLHSGTQCRVVLPTTEGKLQTIGGKVAMCRHVTGMLHEVGVQFTERIDPERFATNRDGQGDAAKDDAPKIEKTILYLHNFEADARLLSYHLRRTGARMTGVLNVNDAIELLKDQDNPVDLVISDLNVEESKIKEEIDAMRATGYEGPIVVMTVESDPCRLTAASKAGACAVVFKPYDPSRLVALLGRVAAEGGEPDPGNDAVYSELEETPDSLALVEQYICEVKKCVTEITRHTAGGQVAGVRLACQKLLGTGAGHGFPQLSEAARQTLVWIDATQSLDDAKEQLQELEKLCKRLRAKRS